MFVSSRTLCSRTCHVRLNMFEGQIFLHFFLRRNQLQKTNRKTMVFNSKTFIFEHSFCPATRCGCAPPRRCGCAPPRVAAVHRHALRLCTATALRRAGWRRKSMNSLRKSMIFEENRRNPSGNQLKIKASTRKAINSLRKSMFFEENR